MSDAAESTPSPNLTPDTWEDFGVFRETYLSLLPPAERAACRLLGRRLYLDRHELVLPHQLAPGESSIRRELRTAAADLAFLIGYLGVVGRGLDLRPEDAPLLPLAQSSASVLEQVRGRILTRLALPTHEPEAA